MQKLSLFSLQPGMTIARDIVNAEGRLLIRNGVVLNKRYIDRLREMGIGSVYIQTPLDEEAHDVEIVQEQTKVKAVAAIKKTFDTITRTKSINTAEFRPVIEDIIGELLHNRNAVLHMTDIRAYDDYTFGHSINVCIYSAFVGVALGYSEARLKDLALGAILHDIGKVLVPTEILNKPARLTEAEMDIVRQHAAAGFEILRKSPEFSSVAAHVAFQHQERLNGSGYPRELKGEEIHEYARIAAIADVYDALTSDRPYRQGMLPHEAYEYMSANAGIEFDYHLLKIFFKRMALYPVGTILQLNTGEIGIVVQVLPELSLRPVVKILVEKDGSAAIGRRQVDLTKMLTVMIDRVCTENEVIALYRRLGMDLQSSSESPSKHRQ